MYKKWDETLERYQYYCDEMEISDPIMVTDAKGNRYPLDSPEGIGALEEFKALNMEGPQVALERFIIQTA